MSAPRLARGGGVATPPPAQVVSAAALVGYLVATCDRAELASISRALGQTFTAGDWGRMRKLGWPPHLAHPVHLPPTAADLARVQKVGARIPVQYLKALADAFLPGPGGVQR